MRRKRLVPDFSAAGSCVIHQSVSRLANSEHVCRGRGRYGTFPGACAYGSLSHPICILVQSSGLPTVQELRRQIIKFERIVQKNTEMRARFADDPSK